ncbi:rhodanese-like domain-containing protein [Sarocladium implicatum]|nr:rhodanese-like domain-containing protein [Sarocladium implicatum]
MATIGTLQRMNAQTLSEKILAEKEATDPTFAVVDVRDDDHVGGHIKGSTHVPSGQLDVQMPTLVRKLADKDTVVFHCALSQQRGPSAALKYLREKEEMLKRVGAGEGKKEQKVFVLDRGFVGWQEVFGTDERLTEAYVKDLWENY